MLPLQKQLIIDAIKLAGQSILQYVGKTNSTDMSKISTFDYGIPADRLSEKIILEAITKSQLHAKIVTEESGIMGPDNAEYTVYIDPLDGSVNFSRGIPSFCIAIALFKGDTPLLGIVYDPCLDELFVAEKGKGVMRNNTPIERQNFTSHTFVHLEWFGAPEYEKICAQLKQSGIRARTCGSGVLALCYGCIGRGDATILLQNRPWDIAPGLIFAEEFGLQIQQINGKNVDFSLERQSIIIAPKSIFETLKNALK